MGFTVACVIGAAGGLLISSTFISWFFLKYITCTKWDPKQHTFQEKACLGGRLYYRGDVPILELDGNNPYQAGQAHGYLMGKHIHVLKRNLDMLVGSLLRHPRAVDLPQTLANLKKQIPPAYLQEMAGLSEGYNRWAKEVNVATSMSADDVLLIHLIADSKHFQPKREERRSPIEANALTGMACTTILHRDPKNGPIAARTMDWCGFGEGGRDSYVVVYKPQNIAFLGVPGLIGPITGWNQHGLAVITNVAPGKTDTARGLPLLFYNRALLENNRTVREAEEWTKKVRPLGEYHLTLMDKRGEGECISLYQGPNGQDYIRRLQDEDPLLVVNWKYPERQKGYFNSKKRTELLTRYFQNAVRTIPPEQIEWNKLVENALELTPLVNSYITLHRVLFYPEKVVLSFNDGYAASSPKHTLAMNEVF
jgi:hypothetical protein